MRCQLIAIYFAFVSRKWVKCCVKWVKLTIISVSIDTILVIRVSNMRTVLFFDCYTNRKIIAECIKHFLISFSIRIEQSERLKFIASYLKELQLLWNQLYDCITIAFYADLVSHFHYVSLHFRALILLYCSYCVLILFNQNILQ